MIAELITSLEAAGGIEEGWRQLAALRGTAFLTPEWYRAWLESAGAGHEPMIIAARRESGELAGVLPLALDRTTRPNAIRFAGAGFGDRFGVAAAPADESEVAAAAMPVLEAAAGSRAMVVLHRIDQDSEWPAAMAAASARRLAVIEQSPAELPHVSVRGLDWEGYLAQRSQKFRQRVGRGLEKALARDGVAFSVRETADPAELEADMATLFRLHDLRRARSSIASPAARAFLTEFARGALERHWLRLRILEIEGRPAAAFLAWRIGPRYSVYQSGFDPAFASHSAGTLLLNDTVRSAIGEGVDDVDLLLGGEPYKWRFAPEPAHVHTVILVGAARPARLLVSAEAAARRHGRGLAARPGIGRVLRALARLLPGGRRG